MTNVFIGVYWPAREESLDRVTNRALAHFKLLATLGPEFENWFEKVDSLKAKRRIVETEAFQPLKSHIAKGRNYRDIPREPIIELGWRISVWNGQPDAVSGSTGFLCGAYSPHVSNAVTFQIGDIPSDRISVEVLQTAMTDLADIWGARKGRLEINDKVVARLSIWRRLLPPRAYRGFAS
jgi:hypothetical protein